VTPARCMIHGLVVGAALLVGLTACASRPHPSTPHPSTSPTSTTAASAAPVVSSPAETCQALTDMDVLSAAEGFVLVGGAVQPGDITNTVISLESIQRDAATVFQTALGNIIDTLRSLDAAVTDGTWGTVDTATVQPDARLLAGMCRARGLAVPAVI
jgi:hypothetical protein